jgi:hypothetical protein
MRSRGVHLPCGCAFVCAPYRGSQVHVRLAEKVIQSAVLFSELL